MKKWKRFCGVAASAALGLATMAGLSGCGGGASGSDVTFTYWVYNGVDSAYYADYNENPTVLYTLEKGYGPEEKQIQFEFWVPPAGTAADNFSNMMGSGEYADVIQNVIGDNFLTSYTDGVSLDITEYVKENMPNYLAYLEAHPQLKADAVTEIDGEEHYLGLVSFNEDYAAHDWGHMYRRDWIVKYGTNPQTGAAFSGGYTDEDDPDSWEDDVVFPSGGSDPVYISDWEWMFEIFEKAYADLGLTDSYCYSVPYNGYLGTGELTASFGGGASGYWFRNLDNEVTFGPVTEEFRTYMQCMNTWYEKGWLDPHFEERVSDMFYAIDSTNVRLGKVGMWYGLPSQLGARMDAGDELTGGICVYGCETPMNDMYGSEATRFKEPYCGFGGTLIGNGFLITTSAEGKDLATLCSYFDFFYSEEGSRIRSLGLDKEQVEESGNEFFAKWGLEDGCYSETEEGKYLLNQSIRDSSGDLLGAVSCQVLPGVKLVSSVDYGYADNFQHALDLWGKYENIGFFQGSSMLDSMTEEDDEVYSDISTKIGEYMSENAAKFVTGEWGPYDDADWATWTKMMEKYNYQKVNDVAQKYADLYPLQLD